MSITNVITRITVDMAGDVKRFAVKAKQYDRATRVIVVSLLWDEVPYVLDSADTVRCNVHKPDGTIAIIEGDNIAVSGNTVTITLPGSALTAAGRAWADIEIETQDESQQVSCQCFEIDIAKSPVDDDSIISTNEFSAMKLATKAANDAAAAATAEIEATAAAGRAASQAAEAAQAATDAANQAAEAATASIQIDTTLTDNTKAAPAGMVGQIKEDLSVLDGEAVKSINNAAPDANGNINIETNEVYTISGAEPSYYTDNTKYDAWAQSGKIYKTSRIIPAGNVIDTIAIGCGEARSGAICFVDAVTNKVLDVTSAEFVVGINTYTINKTFNVAVSVAIYNAAWRYKMNAGYESSYALNLDGGLYEASASAAPSVNDTISFSRIVTVNMYYAQMQWTFHQDIIVSLGSVEEMIAGRENATTSGEAYLSGDYLIRYGKLYKVIANIAIGDTFDGKLIEVSVMGELGELRDDLESAGSGYTESDVHLHPESLYDATTDYTNTSNSGRIYYADCVIPANAVIGEVKYAYSTASNTLLVVVNNNTKEILDCINLPATASNKFLTHVVNKSYSVDTIIGFFGASWRYKHGGDIKYVYSLGIKESNISNPTIGDVVTITTSLPSTKMCFALQITYTTQNTVTFASIKAAADAGKTLALATQKWLPIGLQFGNKNLRYVETSNDIELVGRWYDKNVNGLNCKVTNNSGAQVFFKVKGASTVAVTWVAMTETNAYYSYNIDGGAFTRVSIASSTITLPDTGEHIVRLVTDGITENIGKWTNGTGYALANISVSAGSIKGVYPMNPQIMFFGDSIVEGVLALGSSDDMGDVNSPTGSFPWFCAKNLNAVPFFVGYGASGIISTGSFNSAINALKYLYSGVEVPAYYPDAIVIEHGTNDSSSSSANYIAAYEKLLDAINVKYPGVKVYLFIPLNQKHADDIRAIAATYTWCTLVDTEGWYSGALHPSATNAEIIGGYLSDFMKNDIYGLTE